jgi:hypothetical protein
VEGQVNGSIVNVAIAILYGPVRGYFRDFCTGLYMFRMRPYKSVRVGFRVFSSLSLSLSLYIYIYIYIYIYVSY